MAPSPQSALAASAPQPAPSGIQTIPGEVMLMIGKHLQLPNAPSEDVANLRLVSRSWGFMTYSRHLLRRPQWHISMTPESLGAFVEMTKHETLASQVDTVVLERLYPTYVRPYSGEEPDWLTKHNEWTKKFEAFLSHMHENTPHSTTFDDDDALHMNPDRLLVQVFDAVRRLPNLENLRVVNGFQHPIPPVRGKTRTQHLKDAARDCTTMEQYSARMWQIRTIIFGNWPLCIGLRDNIKFFHSLLSAAGTKAETTVKSLSIEIVARWRSESLDDIRYPKTNVMETIKLMYSGGHTWVDSATFGRGQFPGLKRLHIQGFFINDADSSFHIRGDEAKEALSACPNLEVLHLDSLSLDDECIKVLVEQCDELHLSNILYKDDAFLHLQRACSQYRVSRILFSGLQRKWVVDDECEAWVVDTGDEDMVRVEKRDVKLFRLMKGRIAGYVPVSELLDYVSSGGKTKLWDKDTLMARIAEVATAASQRDT